MPVPVGQRNVPDTPKTRSCYTVDKAKELGVHTVRICKNENIFVPCYSEVTDHIVFLAVDAYMMAKHANGIKVTNRLEYNERMTSQLKAIKDCQDLFDAIDFAKALFHLKGRKVKYWSALTEDAERMLTNWHEKDDIRYRKMLHMRF